MIENKIREEGKTDTLKHVHTLLHGRITVGVLKNKFNCNNTPWTNEKKIYNLFSPHTYVPLENAYHRMKDLLLVRKVSIDPLQGSKNYPTWSVLI